MDELSQHTCEINIEIDEEIDETIDEAAIQSAVAATLRRVGVADAAVTIVLTTDDYVRSLNAQYRGIDAPTDVLSFAAHDNVVDAPALAVAEEAAAEIRHFLGDLVIAYPYVVRQAAYYNNSVIAELQLLAVHGTLHLLGYDHDDERSEDVMWSLQEEVLAQFGHEALARRTYAQTPE
jgi:probable rRNA maturation factor